MPALRLNFFRLYDAGRDEGRSPVKLPENLYTEERKERELNKTMKIEGMSCSHCEATVKKALEALPFLFRG